MRFLMLLPLLAGCPEPCEIEGTETIEVVVRDTDGNPVCPDAFSASRDGAPASDVICNADCSDCALPVLEEGTHTVEATFGAETVGGSVDAFFFERCALNDDPIEIVAPTSE